MPRRRPRDAAARRGAPQPIAARPAPPRGAVVVHSRSHADDERLAEYLATLANAERRLAGSALKFCCLPRARPISTHASARRWNGIPRRARRSLEAAGGTVTTLDGAPLRYGKPGFCNPDFIARGSVSPKG